MKATLGRPSDRKRAVVEDLRSQIVCGALSPGSRLPLRTELEQRFKASPLTVQRAFDTLRCDGFIEAKGKLGTFVSLNPPHLFRYALIFPSHPTDSQLWRRFWTALSTAAADTVVQQAREIPIYHGVLGHTEYPEYLQLVEEVKAHRLAGLTFATHPQSFVNTPLLAEANLPRVALTGRTNIPGVHAIHMDWNGLLDKALDHFKSKGCERIAFVGHSGMRGGTVDSFELGLKKRGLQTRPYWVQTVDIASPASARACAHLLAYSYQIEPFDALLIADDHLVEQTLCGIYEAGTCTPQDIEVVAHGNFPLPPTEIFDVRRIGFDSRDAIATCLHAIDRQRRGEKLPPFTHVHPVWENELAEFEQSCG